MTLTYGTYMYTNTAEGRHLSFSLPSLSRNIVYMFLKVCVYFRRSVYTVLAFFFWISSAHLDLDIYLHVGERRLLLRGVQEPWSEGLAAVQSRGSHHLGSQDTNHQDVRVEIFFMHTVFFSLLHFLFVGYQIVVVAGTDLNAYHFPYV